MASSTEKDPANYVDLSIYVDGERLAPERSPPPRFTRRVQLDEPFFLRDTKERDFTEVELRLHRLRDFTVVRQLGEGRSGKVEEVIDERSGKKMARKRFFVPDFRGKRAAAQINQIKGEILSLKRLSHPHIVRFVSCHQQKENTKHLNVYLLMQPVGEHDLQTFMALVDTLEPEVFDKSWIKQWFMCLLSALAYMHSQHVHHDDIKPSNIICRRGRVYFTDFSSSRRVESGEETSTTSPAIATRLFAAPESFRSDENEPLSHGSKTDVYALGLVFVELLVVLGSGAIAAFRDEMFRDYPHFTRQYHRVTHKFRGALEGGWDTESRRFYERFCEPMLQKRRNGRPSARYLFAKLKQQPRAIGVVRCCCRIQNERQSWTEHESDVDVDDETNEREIGSENTGASDKLTRAESDSDSDWVYLKFRDLF
ncbi:dual specificity mitogen-activated protein kinase kinase 1 [Paraphaeosphaeria minitans]|uniref:Dual specificity mitogen-activated protein kinase kinase 1 n=1 Tax=Paraphaeosphaeria minitans TaxID=565426 RepID=A0A9P6KJG1_9PLEO|nr:dual specificity mitogen-activated protein kinase kinase 1 [Paraphaeosphaeria minitans]